LDQTHHACTANAHQRVARPICHERGALERRARQEMEWWERGRARLWGREGAASERSPQNTPKLPPIQLSGHPAIIFGKKTEQPQEKRNGTSEKKFPRKSSRLSGYRNIIPAYCRDDAMLTSQNSDPRWILATIVESGNCRFWGWQELFFVTFFWLLLFLHTWNQFFFLLSRG
jgi:hypothetical protein